MTTKKMNSQTRYEFTALAQDALQADQEEQGLPVARMTVSVRADMQLVAQLDELADRLKITRQDCIVRILNDGINDAIGGYLDVFGKDMHQEFQAGVDERFRDMRQKQMDNFNAGEGDK